VVSNCARSYRAGKIWRKSKALSSRYVLAVAKGRAILQHLMPGVKRRANQIYKEKVKHLYYEQDSEMADVKIDEVVTGQAGHDQHRCVSSLIRMQAHHINISHMSHTPT